MPIRLSDSQLQAVMAAAAQLALEKRDTFLQRLAAGLRMAGIRRPTVPTSSTPCARRFEA